ncbi:FAD/NAD(P)-binding domain-containing protein [Thozetella sp. PMI_491]|nr:FAD/NAD(P)-binding domain-containing protein [Thozetella sp. PMI_491]
MTEDEAGCGQISYSRFACIGTGFSGIGLGATLKRWYGIDDIVLFERESRLGGTWNANKYPGAACDIPSALYSFSFETNPEWTRALPGHVELWDYLYAVANKYGLLPRMRFRVNVEKCVWLEEKSRWRLHIRNLESDIVSIHESQFLFSGTGVLVEPAKIDIPGEDTFQGPIYHSARWPADVDLRDKRVVIFGNGCTATQIVPAIAGETKHLTQFARSRQWVQPTIDETSKRIMRLMLRYVPGAAQLQRFVVFVSAEWEFAAFPQTDAGVKFRKWREKDIAAYMKSKAPERYHSILIPEYELGCKRRVFDTGYLECLHRPNITLTDELAVEVVPGGVRKKDGSITEADIIICANGFVTNHFLGGMEVIGRGGKTVTEHWDSFGGPEAYNCSVLSDFPNFFMLLGPNATTGHTSAVMAIENSINYALRIIKPVLDGKGTIVEIKRKAEQQYVTTLQAALANTVWASGCNSWYLKDISKISRAWNASIYPFRQHQYWYRSLFPTWGDWQFRGYSTTGRRYGQDCTEYQGRS